MYCKPSQVLPAIVHPTKCCTQHTYNNIVQPHIHPSHTNTINHTNVQNQHYYPHSQSVANEVTSQDYNMGPGPSVAGAYTPGMPGQVAGAHKPSPGYGGACCNSGYKRGLFR
ncbi:spore coat protein [Rossellomorea yichunensis]|uniref:spore coat protein n=1 Tax=Rossellomorea yichunensis TaxID=3077331 RepID=UPI0028DE3828|nr:spore coat protein [Rossellomorea sp. YC4-1]MDT9027491.1 spore coat protein [Rossellomorea sp. YC4-1]